MATSLAIATVLGVLTLGLVIWHVVSKRRAGALLAAPEINLAALRDESATLASELGGGDFKRLVTLRGEIQCADPLESPLGEKQCVYYRAEVERKYRTTDSEGKKSTRTQNMSDQSEARDFELVVGDEHIKVFIDGADHEALVETVDRFEPHEASGMTIGFGQFSMTLPDTHRRETTLGYRYQEYVLPLTGQLTVVGEVSDRNGELSIARGGLIFLFSKLTRNELIGKASTTARWTAVGSGVSLVGALISAVVHLLS